jgi:predicted nucleic acid-binding protein
MSFVLDASAALAWVFERADATEAREAVAVLDRLATDEAIVPELWHLEVLNALVVGCRRKAIATIEAVDFLDRLDALPIRTHGAPLADRKEQLFGLAREHDLSAYDAAYLDLAIRTQSPLATFDRRLAAARDRTGLGPP